jgi:hypothetical protein
MPGVLATQLDGVGLLFTTQAIGILETASI